MTEEWEGETEPKVDHLKITASNWEDEDDESLPDNWDSDSEEEKKKAEAASAAAAENGTAAKTESKLRKKIREKEEAELEKKAALKALHGEDCFDRDLSPAEIRAKELEESIMMVKEITGPNTSMEGSIDAMMPSSKDDFEDFRKRLENKILKFKDSPHYAPFLDQIIRTLTDELEFEEIKTVFQSLNVLLLKKEKKEREKNKKPGKKKGVKVKLESETTVIGDEAYDDYDELGDFM